MVNTVVVECLLYRPQMVTAYLSQCKYLDPCLFMRLESCCPFQISFYRWHWFGLIPTDWLVWLVWSFQTINTHQHSFSSYSYLFIYLFSYLFLRYSRIKQWTGLKNDLATTFLQRYVGVVDALLCRLSKTYPQRYLVRMQIHSLLKFTLTENE